MWELVSIGLQTSLRFKGIVCAKQVLMPVVPATALLAGAGLCFVVGRFLLLRKALGAGMGWLCAVLLVPFGPLYFRSEYPDLARSTPLWRRAAVVFLLLFFLDGGNLRALRSLKDFGKPGAVQESAGDTDFHLSTPDKLVAATVGADGVTSNAGTPGKPTVAPPTTPAPSPEPTRAAPPPTAPPSPAVAAAIAHMALAPKVQTRDERILANRQEFQRLADWYDRLKHERGYLRKGDDDAADAYNAEVRGYETALQLAKTEQAALTTLTAQK